jgi:hypothetical protein
VAAIVVVVAVAADVAAAADAKLDVDLVRPGGHLLQS